MTIEVMNFSYTTPAAKAMVRLVDPSGRVLKEFAPIPLKQSELSVKTLRLKHEEMNNWDTMRVQTAVVAEGGNPQWKELYPIIRRSGRTESVRTIRLRQDDITEPTAELCIKTEKNGKQNAIIRLKTWVFAGKAELLRNGWPIMDTEINHLRKPVWEWSVSLPEMMRSPADVYTARFTDVSGRIGFSTTVRLYAEGVQGHTQQPVIVTGSDFDEN